jgi:hypothetical protein
VAAESTPALSVPGDRRFQLADGRPASTRVSGPSAGGLAGRLGNHGRLQAAVLAQTAPRPPGAPALYARGHRGMDGADRHERSQAAGAGDFRSSTSDFLTIDQAGQIVGPQGLILLQILSAYDGGFLEILSRLRTIM